MASKDVLLERLKNGVVTYQEDEVKAAARQVLDEGHDALEMVMDGLAAGMKIVGELYDRNEYYVPEMLLCADALYAGLAVLRPHIPEQDGGLNTAVVIGTIEGDVHDIGKNLVKMMFDVAGWQVRDLGNDVAPEKFLEAQIETGAELVAVSAMMTTTMRGMQKVTRMIKGQNPDVAVMLGGAPVTRDVADLFGADGYADSAARAVAEASGIIGRFRDQKAK